MELREAGKWAVRQKLRIERGKSWLSFLSSFLLLGVFLRSYSIPDWLFFSFSLVGLFLLWAFGWLDEKRGVWKYENARITRELNPHLASVGGATRKNPAQNITVRRDEK